MAQDDETYYFSRDIQMKSLVDYVIEKVQKSISVREASTVANDGVRSRLAASVPFRKEFGFWCVADVC